MDFKINPALQKLIDEDIKAGRSTNPDEFLDKAVYHYVIARDLGEDFSREEVEEKIAQSLAEAERGKTIDCEEAFRQLRAYSAERRRQRA